MATLARNRKLAITALLSLISVAVSCGKDDSSSPSQETPGVQNHLVFTRGDSTTISMGTDYAICCGEWEPGYDDRYVFKIFFYDPTLGESFWKLFIVVDDVAIDSLYTLSIGSKPPLAMFLLDVSTSNEFASDDQESSGTIVIESLDCGPPRHISFSIDARLGCEDAPVDPVAVSGTFSATVSSDTWEGDCEFSM